jgi:hypothetical protein
MMPPPATPSTVGFIRSDFGSSEKVCECKSFAAKEKERIRVEMDFIRELFDQSKEDGLSDLEQQILDFFVKDVSAWVNSHD